MPFDQIQETQTQNFTRRDRFKRVGQREVLPVAIKSRNLASFIFRSGEASGSISLINGDSLTINYTLTQNSEFDIFGSNYIALYVGSETTANQLFPVNGVSQDITDWQISGPAHSLSKWETGGFLKYADYSSINVVNVSAGSVTLITTSRWR
ncbi:hypothetical protein LCGC14_2292250, partial [marine sediment metagenome]